MRMNDAGGGIMNRTFDKNNRCSDKRDTEGLRKTEPKRLIVSIVLGVERKSD